MFVCLIVFVCAVGMGNTDHEITGDEITGDEIMEINGVFWRDITLNRQPP